MRAHRRPGPRLDARRRVLRAWSGALLLVSLLAPGCGVWGNDVVRIKIKFAASSADRQLTDLTAVVGGDKYSWEVLHGGAIRDINLLPGPRDDRQLFFSYTLDGQPRHWDGPKFDAGTGYEIEVTVAGDGTVTSRHCLLPCTLN